MRVVVTQAVKGGVIVVTNGTRVFIPASQTGVPRSGKLEDLVKKTVQFKVCLLYTSPSPRD